uniref:Uncharacterized protein n=1 Tax=Amphimedon queenslandica TaxID=400682 RepID=A0A1X7TUX1_AMPQE
MTYGIQKVKLCAIVAPTGIAAFNVCGLTIHRLFQLPIEHEGKTAEYWALNEVSVVSNLNLAYLHMSLEDIFGTDEWFESKNILIYR